jgi:hypothetical protein
MSSTCHLDNASTILGDKEEGEAERREVEGERLSQGEIP